jgi:hypothetical protein
MAYPKKKRVALRRATRFFFGSLLDLAGQEISS